MDFRTFCVNFFRTLFCINCDDIYKNLLRPCSYKENGKNYKYEMNDNNYETNDDNYRTSDIKFVLF